MATRTPAKFLAPLLAAVFLVIVTGCSSGSSTTPAAPSGPTPPVSRVAVTLANGGAYNQPETVAQDVTLRLGGLPSLQVEMNIDNESSFLQELSLGVIHVEDVANAASLLQTQGHLTLYTIGATDQRGVLAAILVAGKYQLLTNGYPTNVVITVLQADGQEAASTTPTTPQSTTTDLG